MQETRMRECVAGGDDGAVTILVLVGLTAFLGMASLAVDLGHLATARTESQRVADAAALAGAAAFVHHPGPAAPTLAVSLAKEFAARNRVDGSAVLLQDGDIEVDAANERVRVTVAHTAARGNAIPTLFARVLGVHGVDIVTVATAEASPATGVSCLLPLALPDRWEERGGNPNGYDPGIDHYQPWDPERPDAGSTGWNAAHAGTRVVLKPFRNKSPSRRGRRGGRRVRRGGAYPNASWYYAWRPPGQQGAADYRENVARCVDPELTWSLGQQVDTEPGNMAGPTRQGVRRLVDRDPEAAWNDRLGCVTDRSLSSSDDPGACRPSPRVRAVPMFDPTEAPNPGKKPFTFRNFAGVFVEGMQGRDVVGVFTGFTGVGPANAGRPAAPPLVKVLRLIE